MAKEKRARLTKERIRRFLNIQNEERVYFVLQLVFAALQCVLAYVTIGQGSFNQFGIALFVVYGAVLALLAAKGWQHKAVRILGRTLAAVKAEQKGRVLRAFDLFEIHTVKFNAERQ